MAIPVISASSSILGFKRNETFNFQPSATGLPVRWEAIGLPPGVSIETHSELAATGVASSDIVTASGSAYANGDRVYFTAITGGTGLTAGTIYFVRDVAGATFKLAATLGGAAINFTTDISAATLRKVSSGLISGACATAGVYVATVTAINASVAPEAGSREFVFGINGLASSGGSGSATAVDAIVLQVEVPSGKVSLAGAAGAPADAAGLFALKAGDVRLMVVQFVDKAGERVDPDPATLRFVLKELEPETVLIEAEDFEVVGTGSTAEFLMPVALTGDALTGALSNYEEDDRTTFPALAEIEWTREITFDSAPLTLRASTPNFRVDLDRDLAPNA